jgi:hypothetical protein
MIYKDKRSQVCKPVGGVIKLKNAKNGLGARYKMWLLEYRN